MSAPAGRAGPAESSMVGPLAWLTFLLVLAGYNRLTPLTGRALPGYAFIHWREMISMFVLTPLLALALWRLKERVALAGWAERAFLALLMILGISMGIHEPTNALTSGAIQPVPAWMPTILFLDNTLSHQTFFLGFLGVSVLLVYGQVRRPRAVPETPAAMVVIGAAAVILAAVVFRQMAFEPTQVDITAGFVTLALSVGLWCAWPIAPARAPGAFFLVLAYGLGFGAAALWKLLYSLR